MYPPQPEPVTDRETKRISRPWLAFFQSLIDAITSLQTSVTTILGWGLWTSIPFNAANFTASSGTWGVDSADQVTLAYTLTQKTMTVMFRITNTDVSATPTNLRIALPAGYTAAAKDARNPCQVRDAGTAAIGLIRVPPSDTFIQIFRSFDTTATWATTAGDNTDVSGEITFEVL